MGFKDLFRKKTEHEKKIEVLKKDPNVVKETISVADFEKTIGVYEPDETAKIRIKLGGDDIYLHVAKAWASSENRPVHIDSILGIFGSLAGYACQLALRREYIERLKLPEMLVFMTIDTDNGRKYYMGEPLNRMLMTNTYSLWSSIGGAAVEAGATEEEIKKAIDLEELTAHVTRTIGGPDFGKPRLPEGESLSDIPVHYVEYFWPVIEPLLARKLTEVTVMDWPLMLTAAASKALMDGKEVLSPTKALRIFMECAVPMSKVDPATLEFKKPGEK